MLMIDFQADFVLHKFEDLLQKLLALHFHTIGKPLLQVDVFLVRCERRNVQCKMGVLGSEKFVQNLLGQNFANRP